MVYYLTYKIRDTTFFDNFLLFSLTMQQRNFEITSHHKQRKAITGYLDPQVILNFRILDFA